MFLLQSLIPARLLDPFRTKRKILYHPPDPEILKPPEHDLIQNSPDNYVVTPHRKRRTGFHNSPANPPFLSYSPSYIEDLRSRKGLLSSAPPSYYPGMCILEKSGFSLGTIFKYLTFFFRRPSTTLTEYPSCRFIVAFQ